MEIREARREDIPALCRLLKQVLSVHHEGRPDLFKADGIKYNAAQLEILLQDPSRPVFAAFDDEGHMRGYVFCEVQTYQEEDAVRAAGKEIYIDDLCVEEACRGEHTGTALYQYVKAYAKRAGCRRITLHVWECNPGAKAFYQALGLRPFMEGLEERL